MESYILTRTMHLGNLKETFGKGAVIRYNPETQKLTIDGRAFQDYRDIEILKRQAMKNPQNPWIIQYSEEALQDILGGSPSSEDAIPKRAPNSDGMEIVQSDADSHDTIDISHTQVSRISNEAKEAERNRVKSDKLDVVKGDESVEERIAALKAAENTDIGARAERVRLMSERKAAMPVVKDDSLGSVGSSETSMNAGLPVSGKRAEEAPEAAAMAEARKREAELNRQKVAEEMGIDPDAAGVDEATPAPAPQEQSLTEEISESIPPAPTAEEIEADVESSKDAEIAALKARLAELEAVEKTDKPSEEPPKRAKKPVVSGG